MNISICKRNPKAQKETQVFGAALNKRNRCLSKAPSISLRLAFRAGLHSTEEMGAWSSAGEGQLAMERALDKDSDDLGSRTGSPIESVPEPLIVGSAEVCVGAAAIPGKGGVQTIGNSALRRSASGIPAPWVRIPPLTLPCHALMDKSLRPLMCRQLYCSLTGSL